MLWIPPQQWLQLNALLCTVPVGGCPQMKSFCLAWRSSCPPRAFMDHPMHCRNLALLEKAGAELVFFSPMHDVLPHGVSGIYFGGGCPERYPEELTANGQLMAAVAAFAEAGGVIYAEYAGLVYLSQSLQPVGNLPYAMGKPNTVSCSPCAHSPADAQSIHAKPRWEVTGMHRSAGKTPHGWCHFPSLMAVLPRVSADNEHCCVQLACSLSGHTSLPTG